MSDFEGMFDKAVYIASTDDTMLADYQANRVRELEAEVTALRGLLNEFLDSKCWQTSDGCDYWCNYCTRLGIGNYKHDPDCFIDRVREALGVKGEDDAS